MSTFTRGDIYYVFREEYVGSEMNGNGRPAVVVSNNICNEKSPVIEMCYLTTTPKYEMSTHVFIEINGVKSTILCEQVTSVAKTRIGNWFGKLDDEQMKELDKALIASLDLDRYIYSASNKKCEQEKPQKEKTSDIKVKIERDLYKKLYENILESVLIK